MSENKQTRGRQRIPIKRIQSQEDLYASFSKRRHGLFKKASELSTLCGAQVGVVILTQKNHPHSFFSPSFDSVIDRYQNPNLQLGDYYMLFEAFERARTDKLSRMLDEAREEDEVAKERAKSLAEDMDQNGPIDPYWEDHENMTREQRSQWYDYFKYINAETTRMIEEAKAAGGLGSSSYNPNRQNDASNITGDENAGGGSGEAGPSNSQP